MRSKQAAHRPQIALRIPLGRQPFHTEKQSSGIDMIEKIGHAAAYVAAALCLVLCASHSYAQTRWAISGADILPSPEHPIIRDGVVLIEGARIVRVGPRQSTPIPSDYAVVNQVGGTVIAGFWNSHVHMTTPILLTASDQSDVVLEGELENAFTKWGFTTVFDLASTTVIAKEIASRVSDGQVRGPRILSVGDPFYPPDSTPVYARPFYDAYGLPSAEIGALDEAVARAEQQIRAGMWGLKLFTGSIVGGDQPVSHMSLETVSAITAAANRLGRPVFAHPTDRAGLEVAVQGGVDVLAHAAPLMGAWTPDYARWIVDAGIALIPTLALFEDAAHPQTPVEIAVQQTAAFHRAGGAVLFGTDAGFTDAFDTSAELRLMERALGWRGLIASLTTHPAMIFGEDRIRGRIADGHIADIVIVGADPSEDVAALTDVKMVIRAGEVVFSR